MKVLFECGVETRVAEGQKSGSSPSLTPFKTLFCVAEAVSYEWAVCHVLEQTPLVLHPSSDGQTATAVDDQRSRGDCAIRSQGL